ncbi:MAG TPA: protein-glutamate O-methyltransferase CheR [Candidatus Saccharimonadales bacterium]|nr:protein-glutamate O-methyltransferase CheR [Candidatus Saccharimonadales bacterium]
MAISDAEFHYIKDFIYQQAAIDLEPGKAYLVESRLQPIARREGFASLSDMIAKLRAQPANGLNWLVVEAMTTNETYFFRDVHPFELLKTKVLPELIKRRAAQRQINIWCAAASSGQEPYSIMMLLREHFPELSTWKINFTATDISNQMLNRCREGFYSQLEVNRGLPVTLLVKYFEKISTEWKIRDDLRRAIDFRQLNLAQPWPALATMDIVFIRNVLIYFDVATKKPILARVRRLMSPDGYMFLGGAETTLNLDESFKRVQVNNSAYYQLNAA